MFKNHSEPKNSLISGLFQIGLWPNELHNHNIFSKLQQRCNDSNYIFLKSSENGEAKYGCEWVHRVLVLFGNALMILLLIIAL